MRLELRKSAVKDIDKLDASQRKRILSAIAKLDKFPAVPHIKRLSNFDYAYRLRVGDFRILFDLDGDVIIIARVLPRKAAYQ